jgi:hypothetical protein
MSGGRDIQGGTGAGRRVQGRALLTENSQSQARRPHGPPPPPPPPPPPQSLPSPADGTVSCCRAAKKKLSKVSASNTFT